MKDNTFIKARGKKYQFILGVVLVFCLVGYANGGEKAYITDTLNITFRTGPSIENKIISMLSSSQPVEVLETEGDWSHIKLLEDAEGSTEGWVLSRYLIRRQPWEMQANALRRENKELKEKLNPMEKKMDEAVRREQELLVKLRDTNETLQKLETEYGTLKRGAAGYLKLRDTHRAIQSKLDFSQREVQKLADENDRLRTSERNKWFAIGALVLLCGFIIGLIIGRQQKKRRSAYY